MLCGTNVCIKDGEKGDDGHLIRLLREALWQEIRAEEEEVNVMHYIS